MENIQKKDILSMPFAELERYALDIGLPKYRAKQIFTWLSRGVKSFFEMSDLPADLREKLDSTCYISALSVNKKFVSALDGTVKYLFSLSDGNSIETALMKYDHGNTVCISSQVGCRMGCAFCASTLKGKVRDLTAGEMFDQILFVHREYGVDNVVIMGIGEPLDNYSNLLDFLSIVSDPNGFNKSCRHISVSTCGLADKINDLAEKNLQITLSISLHAPNDETRNTLMPVNKRWNTGLLFSAARNYSDKTRRRICFEYIMISGLNDTPAHAVELAKKLRGIICHVNLIPVNPVEGKTYQPSTKAAISKFRGILEQHGVTSTVRRTLGGDISASCGQLRHRETLQ